MGRDSKDLLHRCGRFDQHMQWQQQSARGGVDVHQSLLHLRQRLHFGQHDIGKSFSSCAHNGAHVVCKVGMVQRMQTYANARCQSLGLGSRNRKLLKQVRNGLRLLGFGASGYAVLAVQRDVHDTAAHFGHQSRLQLQALAHARRVAAVMVAYRQSPALGLRA